MKWIRVFLFTNNRLQNRTQSLPVHRYQSNLTKSTRRGRESPKMKSIIESNAQVEKDTRTLARVRSASTVHSHSLWLIFRFAFKIFFLQNSQDSWLHLCTRKIQKGKCWSSFLLFRLEKDFRFGWLVQCYKLYINIL